MTSRSSRVAPTAPPPSTAERLAEWRQTVARVYLRGLTFGLPLIILIRVFGTWPPRLSPSLALLTVGWLLFVALQVFAPPRLQAVLMVVLVLLTGTAGISIFGLSLGPALAVASGILIAAATFGRRAGLFALASSVTGYLGLGALASRGWLPFLSPELTDPTRLENWLRLSAFFTIALGMLLVALTGLVDRLERAWHEAEAAAERERAEHQQRLRAEAERHEAMERGAQAQRLEAIGRLAGGVAHDFNNLLVVIMSWADLLPNVKTEGERKEGLAAIRDASAQAAQLTRQLLSFARQEVVHPTAVDLDAAVAGAMKSLRRLLPGDITLDHAPAGPAPCRALVDETQLSQVLFNLAANARDAMPRGGTLTLSTALVAPPDVPPEALDRNTAWATLTVADTGVGMDEATRARAFEPFFSTKERGRGTGLGLASVLGVVSQAHGWVKVDSAPGQGTRITVAFLEAPVAAPAVEARPAAEGPSAPSAARVLLAEDDRAVRSAMARALRDAGLEVLEARDADEALTMARRFSLPIDLLCTDGVMPGSPTHILIDGFRQLFPSSPVLVCSGYVEEELVRRGIAEGALAVLPKPFAAEVLVARVRALLSG